MSSPVSGQIYGDLLDELWTGSVTGSDGGSGDPNVWTLDVAGQSWTTLTDISASGNSLTAGQGFLVYVFTDTDFDGDNDLSSLQVNVFRVRNPLRKVPSIEKERILHNEVILMNPKNIQLI